MTDYLELMNKEGTFAYYFKKISEVPRGSYNNREISDKLVEFAKKRGLRYIQDESLNVVIYKDASKGFEECSPVIIQGHMDMVCEKAADSNHDFVSQGLCLEHDDKYIYAKDTTLGADDGIAVAYALAILDDDSLMHPSLEVVITTDEEVGMDGAKALDTSVLKGKYMLNLDSEDEGLFLTGCAGGLDVNVELKASYCEAKGKLMTIEVGGLKGGHSGSEIDKNRTNADILLGRILNELRKEYFRINLACVRGGNKDNVIPCASFAKLIVDERMSGIEECLDKVTKTIKAELASSEPDLCIRYSFEEGEWEKVFSTDCERNIIRYLMVVPDGVIKMSSDIEGLVETSLNLGIMETKEDSITFVHSVRSSVESCKYSVYDRICTAADCVGGTAKAVSSYPGWKYEKDSKLRETAVALYEQTEHKSAIVTAIHAGLECGLIKDKMPNLDIISYGPDIKDIHTVNERMDMESAIRVYDFTVELIKRIGELEIQA